MFLFYVSHVMPQDTRAKRFAFTNKEQPPGPTINLILRVLSLEHLSQTYKNIRIARSGIWTSFWYSLKCEMHYK